MTEEQPHPKTLVLRLAVPVTFPEGVAPGEGRESNHGTLALDGAGRYVLRGSALAGALRHAYARSLGARSTDREVERWFGKALSGETQAASEPSRLHTFDSVLSLGKGTASLRTHNAVNRHTGAVLDGSLVTLQALPPGTRMTAILRLEHILPEQKTEAEEFLRQLTGCLAASLTLGGHASRGVGRVKLGGQASLRTFDLSNLADHAAFLDESREIRQGKKLAPPGSAIDITGGTGGSLEIVVNLEVPRGQDFVVGDTTSLDHEIEPQKVQDAEGKVRYRIPGSSFKGIFRAWYSRLAHKAGEPIADSPSALAMEKIKGKELRGGNLAWGLRSVEERKTVLEALEKDPRELKTQVPCPVQRLFGSAFSRGRIRFSDILFDQPSSPAARMHVAVDRITGGATDGMLFSNTVISSPASFKLHITIESPEKAEVERIAKTLLALHLGILRVGSSKAAGRLAVKGRPALSGQSSAEFGGCFSRLEELTT